MLRIRRHSDRIRLWEYTSKHSRCQLLDTAKQLRRCTRHVRMYLQDVYNSVNHRGVLPLRHGREPGVEPQSATAPSFFKRDKSHHTADCICNMLQNYRFVVATLLVFCVLVPPSSICEAARICKSPSLIPGPIGKILRIPHTWVQHSFSCRNAGVTACGQRTPFTGWSNIGFEIQSGAGPLFGQGRLRDDSGTRCVSWVAGRVGAVARAASAQQERDAVAALVRLGWNDAFYGIQAGMRFELNDVGCQVFFNDYRPRTCPRFVPPLLRPGVCPNVCWSFSCAFVSYLWQELRVRPRAIGSSEMSVRSASEIPSDWTCAPEQYDSGDGCQCSCGAFDPDCDPMSAVPVDCPNHDDICVVGPLDAPICMLRHEVRSKLCSRIRISLAFVSTLLVSDHVCFRFLANERLFKSYQESQFIILYSISLMTPIPKTAHGATTAALLRVVTCPPHGLAANSFTGPTTAAIATAEYGTLTVMPSPPKEC